MKLPKPFTRTQKQVVLTFIAVCVIGFYASSMWNYWFAATPTCKPSTVSDELSQRLAEQLARFAEKDWGTIANEGHTRFNQELFTELKNIESLSSNVAWRIFAFHNAMLALGGYLIASDYAPGWSRDQGVGEVPESVGYHYVFNSNRIGLAKLVFRWGIINIRIERSDDGQFANLRGIYAYLPEALEPYPGWKAPRQVTPCPTLPEELREAYRAQYPESWRAHNPS